MISNSAIRKVIRHIWEKESLQIADEPAEVAEGFASAVPTPDDLYRKAQEKLASGDDRPWAKDEVTDEVASDMAIFATHPSLIAKMDIDEPGFHSKEGEVRAYIAPDSMFVRYLSSYAASQGPLFNAMICDIYKMLSMCCKIKDQEKIEQFFAQFPPRTEEELQCLPGSIARFKAVLTAMTDKTPLESLFYQCHTSVINKLTAQGIEVLKSAPSPDEDPENQSYHVHVRGYVKYILGFRNVAQTDQIDRFSMLIPDFLTAAFECEVLDSYNRLFNDELSRVSRDEVFITQQDDLFLQEIIQSAIKKSNQNGSMGAMGSFIADDLDLFSLQFDEYMSIVQVDGEIFAGDNGPRLSLALSNLIADIYNYHGEGIDPENVQNFIAQYCSTVEKGDDSLYQIDREKLRAFASQRRAAYFGGEIAARQSGHRTFDMRMLNSVSAKGAIYELLTSGKVDEAKSAIDALFLLSEKVNGAASIHFVEMIALKNKDGIDLLGLLYQIVKNEGNKFDFLYRDQEFVKIYLPRINQFTRDISYPRWGVIPRVQSQYKENQQNLVNSFGVRSRGAVVNLDSLFKLSTEELLQFLNIRFFLRVVHDDESIKKVIILAHDRVDNEQIFAKILATAPNKFLESMIRVDPRLASEEFYNFLSSKYVEDITPDRLTFLFSSAINSDMREGNLILLFQRFDRMIDLSYAEPEDGNSLLHLSINKGKLNLAKAIAQAMIEKEDFDISALISGDNEGPLDFAIAKITEYQTEGEDSFEVSDYKDYELVVDLISKGFTVQNDQFTLPEFYGIIIRSQNLSFDQKKDFLTKLASFGVDHEVNYFVAYDPLESFLDSVEGEYLEIDSQNLELIKILVAAGCNVNEQLDSDEDIVDLIFNSTALSAAEKKSFVAHLCENDIDINSTDILLKLVMSDCDDQFKIELLYFLIQNNIDLTRTFIDFDECVDNVEKLGILYFAAQKGIAGINIFKELLRAGVELDYENCRGIEENEEIVKEFKGIVATIEARHRYMTQEMVGLEDVDIINDGKYLQGQQLLSEDQVLSKKALFYRNQDGVSAFEILSDKYLARGTKGCPYDFIEKLDSFISSNRRLIGEELAAKLDELNARIIISIHSGSFFASPVDVAKQELVNDSGISSGTGSSPDASSRSSDDSPAISSREQSPVTFPSPPLTDLSDLSSAKRLSSRTSSFSIE